MKTLADLYSEIDPENDGGKWDFCYNFVANHWVKENGKIVDVMYPREDLATTTMLYYALEFVDDLPTEYKNFPDTLMILLNLPPILISREGHYLFGRSADFFTVYYFIENMHYMKEAA